MGLKVNYFIFIVSKKKKRSSFYLFIFIKFWVVKFLRNFIRVFNSEHVYLTSHFRAYFQMSFTWFIVLIDIAKQPSSSQLKRKIICFIKMLGYLAWSHGLNSLRKSAAFSFVIGCLFMKAPALTHFYLVNKQID